MNEANEWCAAYLDGPLEPSQQAALEQWLRERPEHLHQFVEACLFDGQLREVVRSLEAGRGAAAFGCNMISPPAQPVARWTRRLVWLAAAATLVALAIGMWSWRARPETEAQQALAEITARRGAVDGSGEIWQRGRQLAAGRITLTAGALELAMVNGVGVVFEGPGELELLSPMRAALHSGQVVVRVPEAARGFQLDTASTRVVDHGTEFGVMCGRSGATEVLVFDGEITAAATAGNGGFPRRLTTGDARRFAPGATQPEVVGFHPERFVRSLPAERGREIEGDGFPFNTPTVETVEVFPARNIVVDGELSDWGEEGLFRGVRSAVEFVEGRLRYDADHLYVAARIGDPAPLRNIVNPAMDGEFGWRGGGLQIRLGSDAALGWPVQANAAAYYQMRGLPVDEAMLAQAVNPALVHLTLWHHAPTAQNCLHVAYGMDFHAPLVNPPGYRAAARKSADGRAYTLEYAIPWRLLKAPRAPRAGETLPMSWTAHWSDESGRLWRGQLTEIAHRGEPVRIHPWERAATWGRAVFR